MTVRGDRGGPRRALSRWALGCIGTLSLLGILCTGGWYAFFVRNPIVRTVERVELDAGGELAIHVRRTLPGGDAFLVERSASDGDVRWRTAIGARTELPSTRIVGETALITLRSLDDTSGRHVGIALEDGAIRFEVETLGGSTSSVMAADDFVVECDGGHARRISMDDGRIPWTLVGDPREMPTWPVIRGGEVIVYGRIVDATTGREVPPGVLPSSWCQTPAIVAWGTERGVARRRRGSSDVVEGSLGGELDGCESVSVGSLVVTRDADGVRRLALLGADLAPRWTVVTPAAGELCAVLVDGAVAQRLAGDVHDDRVARFDVANGRRLDDGVSECWGE